MFEAVLSLILAVENGIQDFNMDIIERTLTTLQNSQEGSSKKIAIDIIYTLSVLMPLDPQLYK